MPDVPVVLARHPFVDLHQRRRLYVPALRQFGGYPVGEHTHATRREIVSHYLEDGQVWQIGTHPIDGEGDIHDCDTPADAARETLDHQAAVDALIAALEPSIGREKYLELEAAVNNYAVVIRCEAIARMVTAAQAMIDHPISVFVTAPAGDQEQEPAAAADEP